MGKELLTQDGIQILSNVTPGLRKAMVLINELRFDESERIVSEVAETLVAAKAQVADAEDVLADLFVLGRYLELVSEYGLLWKQITTQLFSDSWVRLQDALDLLRLIKRFSTIDVSFFEAQLVDLEQLYPYNVFASIGAVVGYFECSICGHDIDSEKCPHVRGNLYKGEIACAIARDFVNFDHVALVTNPEDKRCVISYEDTSDSFRLVRLVGEQVLSRKLRVSDLAGLEWSKRKRVNPAFIGLGRNDKCSCGSGKKFKRCCISKRETEEDHVDVIFRKRDIQDTIV